MVLSKGNTPFEYYYRQCEDPAGIRKIMADIQTVTMCFHRFVGEI